MYLLFIISYHVNIRLFLCYFLVQTKLEMLHLYQ